MVFVGIIRYIMNQPLPFIEILGHNNYPAPPISRKGWHYQSQVIAIKGAIATTNSHIIIACK